LSGYGRLTKREFEQKETKGAKGRINTEGRGCCLSVPYSFQSREITLVKELAFAIKTAYFLLQ
jgi:hypothetical protein